MYPQQEHVDKHKLNTALKKYWTNIIAYWN